MSASRKQEAPLQERIDFYRYIAAGQDLGSARQILYEIQGIDRCQANATKLSYLFTAFYATYGKPFKQQRDKGLKVA